MAPQKRKALSIKTKLDILAKVDKNDGTYEDVGKMFNCAKGTIAGIVRARHKIEESKHGVSARKKLRGSLYPQHEEALIIWLKTMRAKNLNISGNIFREKAIQLSGKMGITNFTATQGWFDRFKKRNAIVFRSVAGESQSVSSEVTTEWESSKLPRLIDGYDKKDVFNLDETALFFKMMPNKTMSFQKETCSGGKLSKERITILVGANSDGSEKLPLLVIGRALKPRCFKNVHSLPVLYKANKKAWMTFHLWEEYIRRLDTKFAKNNRKLIFIVDNAPCHLPISGLQAITIANFPANTTAILQPMDQGIIKNFKGFYRESLVKKIIATIEDDSRTTAEQVKINLLDALHMDKNPGNKLNPKLF